MRNPSESEGEREQRHAREAAQAMHNLEESKSKEIVELKKIIQDIKNENPDPADWELIEDKQIGEYLVLKLRYPKCKNHKGVKIMVFKATLSQLVKQKLIDPHFGTAESTRIDGQTGNMLYPIARFPGNEEGWHDAIWFATLKTQGRTVSFDCVKPKPNTAASARNADITRKHI